MGQKLSQINKLDSAVIASSIDGSATGFYFGMQIARKALFIATLGAMAAGDTAVFKVVQAVDSSGTSSKDVADTEITVTGNIDSSITKLSIVSAAGGVHVAGQTVTINGLVFTAAAADVPETREYAVGATGADSAANLLAKINSEDPAIGISNIIGSSAVVSTDTVITLIADEPGEVLINAVASDSTTIVSTASSIAFIEVEASDMDVNNGFSHLAIDITTSTAIDTGVALVRDHSRYNPEQFVAASAS